MNDDILVIDKPKYILVKKSPINQKPILEPKEQNNGKIFKYDREMYDNFPLFNL